LSCKDDSDALILIFSDPQANRTLTFELKLMTIDSERLVIPETEYKCTTRMDCKEFRSLCQDFHSIGESINICCNKEFIRFTLIGDIGKGDLIYKHNNTIEDLDSLSEYPNSVLIRCEQSVSQNFALRYLSVFTKATSLSKAVNLFISPDVPLVVEYRMDDLGYIKYYLAPKIEDETS